MGWLWKAILQPKKKKRKKMPTFKSSVVSTKKSLSDGIGNSQVALVLKKPASRKECQLASLI